MFEICETKSHHFCLLNLSYPGLETTVVTLSNFQVNILSTLSCVFLPTDKGVGAP